MAPIRTPSSRVERGSSSTLPGAGRSKKEPDHIPRPPNAFILYRTWLNHEHKTTGELRGLQKSLSIDAGISWKELPVKEREMWDARAADAAREHREKYPNYQYRPRRKGQSSNGPVNAMHTKRPKEFDHPVAPWDRPSPSNSPIRRSSRAAALAAPSYVGMFESASPDSDMENFVNLPHDPDVDADGSDDEEFLAASSKVKSASPSGSTSGHVSRPSAPPPASSPWAPYANPQLMLDNSFPFTSQGHASHTFEDYQYTNALPSGLADGPSTFARDNFGAPQIPYTTSFTNPTQSANDSWSYDYDFTTPGNSSMEFNSSLPWSENQFSQNNGHPFSF